MRSVSKSSRAKQGRLIREEITALGIAVTGRCTISLALLITVPRATVAAELSAADGPGATMCAAR